MREYANAAISDTKLFSSHSIIGYINQFKQYGTVFNFPRFLIILRTHFPYFEATNITMKFIHLQKKKKKMVTVIVSLNDFIIHFKNSDYHQKNHHDEDQSLKYNAFKSFFFFFNLTNIVISITISLLF